MQNALAIFHPRRKTVSDGRPDHPRWVIGVCANCDWRAHFSVDAASFNEELLKIVGRLELEN